MNKNLMAAVLAAAGVLASGTAWAEPYLGGALGLTSYEYDDVDTAYGWQAFAGYRFDEVPLQFEVGYIDNGEADIQALPGVALGFTGVNASVGYYMGEPRLGVWFKLGYFSGDSEIGDSSITFVESSDGVMGGLGMDIGITDWLAFRLDLQGYFGMKDFANLDPDSTSTVTVFTAGLVLRMPQTRTSTRSVSNNVRAAPLTPAYPTVTSQSSATAAAPAPAARPAAPTGQQPYAAGQSVAIAKATPLLDQPRSDAGVGRFLALGEVVILRSYVVNARGTWWYVQSSDLTGWVAEPTLGAQQP